MLVLFLFYLAYPGLPDFYYRTGKSGAEEQGKRHSTTFRDASPVFFNGFLHFRQTFSIPTIDKEPKNPASFRAELFSVSAIKHQA